MESITVQSHIGEDGILRLQIPVGIKDADVRVTLELEEAPKNGEAKPPEELGWPPGFFEETYGCLKDLSIECHEQAQSEEVTTASPLTIDELETQAQSNGWPPGYFRQVVGAWQGEPPQRPPQDTYEVRDEFP